MKVFVLVLGLTGVSLPSCAHDEMNYVNKDSIVKMLPQEAKEIQGIGNKWFTFKLPLKGRTRCFLFHKSYEGFADFSFGFEAITELNDCN